ncbi:RNA-directed DNA polymerase, eukaryota, partial [Tanacetum coccineum]
MANKRYDYVVRGKSRNSDESLLARLSCNVYVINFPSHFTVRELRNVCERLGIVSDVFIAKKLSKLRKHFGFVRYLKVNDAQTIIDGLCNTRIGMQKIFANIARFDRKDTFVSAGQDKMHAYTPANNKKGMGCSGMTYANVVQERHANVKAHQMNDKSVVVLDRGCLKDIEDSLTVFACVKEFRSLTNMRSICKNEGFHNVKLKYLGGFWISVEFEAIETCMKFQKHAGVQSWFSSIINPPKEVFIRERVAWIDVEGISVDVRGHVSMVRAEEITGWIMDFVEDSSSMEVDDKGYMEEVRDTATSKDVRWNEVLEKECERNCDGIGCEELPDVGSTPDMVLELQSLNNYSATKPRIVIDGFSMIEKFNEVIEFGHAMGFDMKGRKVKKKWVRELCVKHSVKFLAIQETKKASMSCLAVRSLWGNSFFECSIASSIGKSGGILCVWDKCSFFKDREIICSNFVALEGTWLSSNTKVLIVSVYAPQEFDAKKELWNRLSSMIRFWRGEVILMGDFNEVRWEHERFGSVFNHVQANKFNEFISEVELVDVPLGGYMFTWSDSAASKMSKID